VEESGESEPSRPAETAVDYRRSRASNYTLRSSSHPHVALTLPVPRQLGAVKMSQERARKISIKLRVVRPPADGLHGPRDTQ
jgi:hypothetical protein